MEKVISLIKEGKIEKFKTKPDYIDMALSDIFIFEDEEIVLKIYKENNQVFKFENKKDYLKFVKEDYE